MSSEEWKEKGNVALREGKLEEAIQCFTNGIEIDPANAILYSNRSAAYGQQGSWTTALQDADRTIELRPEWGKAHSRRGLALYRQGRYEEALQSYNTALHFDPTNSDIPKILSTVQSSWKASEQNCLGEEQLSRGKHSVALPFFEEAAKLDPQCALYHSNLSHTYLCLRKFQPATKAAEKVISLRPQWHKGYQRKGEVLHQEGKYQEAAQIFAYALQIEPKNDQLNHAFTRTQAEIFRANQYKKDEPKGVLDSIKDFFGFSP